MATARPISAVFAAGMALLLAACASDSSGGGQESGRRERATAATDSEQAAVVALGWARAALGAAIITLPGFLLRRLFPGKDPDPVAVAIARGFMLAMGCIQAMQCHTNRCPTGSLPGQRARARVSLTRAIGTDGWLAPNQFTTTSDRPIIAPMDRS